MPAFLLPFLSFGKSAVSGAMAFLGKLNVWQIGCIALAALLMVQHFQLAGERRHSARLQAQVVKLTDLRAHDRTNLEAAAREAEAQAKANVQRVETEQARITNETRGTYAKQLADLRARFDRLRTQTTVNPGVAQGPGMPADRSAPDGADGATGERLSPSERQLAAEISLRLRALQAWVRRQAAVPTN